MDSLKDISFDACIALDPLLRGEVVPWAHTRRDIELLFAKACRTRAAKSLRNTLADLHCQTYTVLDPTDETIEAVKTTLSQLLRDVYDLRPSKKIRGVGLAFNIIKNHAMGRLA